MNTNWMRWDFTCRHGDPDLMALANRFLMEKTNRPQLFFVFGHSYEFKEFNNWHVIKQLFDTIAFQESIWYATNIEICEYIKAYRSLVYTDDGRTLYNPAEIPVYIEFEGGLYCICPKKTMKLL